jgi:aminoglycoside phosphotransferase (APT) family kinase protein
MSEALRQTLRALRRTCVQLKSDVSGDVRAQLEAMTTLLARLIVEERDLPALRSRLAEEYRSQGHPGGYRPGTALDPAARRWLAQVEGAFAHDRDRAIRDEIRRGEGLATGGAAAGEVLDVAAFHRYLIARLGEDPALEIADVRLAARGFSKKTILVGLRNSRVLPGQIALRVDRPFNFLGTTVNQEFAPLVALHAAGVRLPRPYALEATGKVLDGPFIIFEQKAGGLIGNNFQAPARNPAIARDVAHCLAQLHRTSIAAVDGIPAADLTPEAQVRQDLDKSQADWSAMGCPEPLLAAAFEWLYANLHRAAGERAVVHGDFNFNNLLIEGDRVSAIVDWEFVHAGNPVADLGWFHYGAQGICGWQEFLDYYAEEGGCRMEPDSLPFFILLGQTRLAVMTLQTEYGFRAGRFDELKFGMAGALYTNKSLLRLAALLTDLP